MAKTIAPILKRGREWFVDTSELHGFDEHGEPEVYGPYNSKADAEEDRAPVVERIKARRQLKIKKYEPAFELSASQLKLALLLLSKMTKGSMRLGKLDVDQRKVLALMLYKWKGPGSLGEDTLADPDTLKRLFYKEAQIDPNWPESEHDFIQWAKKLTGAGD